MLVKTFKWHKVLKYLENSTEGISGRAIPMALFSELTDYLTLQPSVTACRRKSDTNKKRGEMKARSKEICERKNKERNK